MDVEHRVYFSSLAKVAAIAQDTRILLRQGATVIVTTHFSDALLAVQDALSSAGLVACICNTPFDLQGFTNALSCDTPAVGLVMAHLLSPRSLGPVLGSTTRPLVWLVGEHHPTLAGDDAILESARGLASSSAVRFYDSLDSALFMRYGGDQVRGLWTTLDLKGDEYISHPMVARTIRQAQSRISRRVASPLGASSAEAWFQQNLR